MKRLTGVALEAPATAAGLHATTCSMTTAASAIPVALTETPPGGMTARNRGDAPCAHARSPRLKGAAPSAVATAASRESAASTGSRLSSHLVLSRMRDRHNPPHPKAATSVARATACHIARTLLTPLTGGPTQRRRLRQHKVRAAPGPRRTVLRPLVPIILSSRRGHLHRARRRRVTLLEARARV